MWSFGCIVAGMVFNRLPFFRAHGNDDQLRVIVNVLGTTELHRYIQKYNLQVNETLIASLGSCRRRDWSEFASGIDSSHICTELFDLLDNLLIYDHQKRLTAKECMQHPYFREVRERLQGGVLQKSVEQRENRVEIDELNEHEGIIGEFAQFETRTRGEGQGGGREWGVSAGVDDLRNVEGSGDGGVRD